MVIVSISCADKNDSINIGAQIKAKMVMLNMLLKKNDAALRELVVW